MRINFLIINLALLVVGSSGFAYDFPAGFPRVDQAYGDYNGSQYHDGIDLPGNTVGQEVLSPISNGVLIWGRPSATDQGYVCIQDTVTQKTYLFGHIDDLTPQFLPV